ncbi:transposable element Tc3 transposase [Vespula maculifrons]|uniref:Transposable element Tc3 transposase n=1 Tax=Vespula maculifrons TaxID=7453 RepID=A0ABD2CUE1_VESMC
MAYFYFLIEYEQVKVKIKKQKVIILLKTPHKYAKTKCLGLSVSLTAREKRAILRVTSNSLMTVRQVAETAEFSTKSFIANILLRLTKHESQKIVNSLEKLLRSKSMYHFGFYLLCTVQWHRIGLPNSMPNRMHESIK